MTKMRAVGAPQQGLHKPGGPSVAYHTRESRTTVDSRAAGSHVSRAAHIGGDKPPGEVSTLRQRPLGGQHSHGDHRSHDGALDLSATKAPAKKAAEAPKPKAKPRGQASALAEATVAASAAIQSPGASNAPSSTHSPRSRPANSRKRSTSQSAHRKARDSFRGLFDSSSDDEGEEGPVAEPQEISNDLDGQQERYHAAQLQSSNLPSAQASVPVQSTQTAGSKGYPRDYNPPDEGTGATSFLEKLQVPRGRVGGYTSRGAFERELVMNEPLFQENIEAARRVLLASHRIPLKEFTSLRKKPETKGGLHPVWGYPCVQPEGTAGFPQAESVFWAGVLEQGYQRQELGQLKAELALSSVLDQRDLRIEFAHLIAKRQLGVGGSARD
ncbi:unnamed protein product [Phytophthora fragariaefolia]|uniref:Unnamed protein product n=1 Tax=Phytophthora fragariaefolia TaxID=1490495 RepID=A0A9W7CZ91_9STRA|nr:unnamed protein product [Phytophthora fragariaefolia]